MDAPPLMERRKAAAARRQKPVRMQIREFTATGDGGHGHDGLPFPTELRLETTEVDGRIATWFDDTWWLETLRRWKDRPLTIHILPTPDALLHPIVLHELEMVRRLLTPWRVIGHCYLSEIAQPVLMPRVAVNQYDEVRIIDADRPESDDYNVRPARMTLDEVLDRVRVIQIEQQAHRPLLTRAPDPNRTIPHA